MSDVKLVTRRKAIGTAVAAMAFPAAGGRVLAQQPAMEEKPSTGANGSLTSLHQEIVLEAPPGRVFNILLDSKQFAACTGMPAVIDPNPGGTFKTFGGLIEGRNIEIVSDSRIVQAWRPASWEPGMYSIAHFELKPTGNGTALTLDHTGFHEGDFDHLDAGWHMRYWDPLKKYLASK